MITCLVVCVFPFRFDDMCDNWMDSLEASAQDVLFYSQFILDVIESRTSKASSPNLEVRSGRWPWAVLCSGRRRRRLLNFHPQYVDDVERPGGCAPHRLGVSVVETISKDGQRNLTRHNTQVGLRPVS